MRELASLHPTLPLFAATGLLDTFKQLAQHHVGPESASCSQIPVYISLRESLSGVELSPCHLPNSLAPFRTRDARMYKA